MLSKNRCIFTFVKAAISALVLMSTSANATLLHQATLDALKSWDAAEDIHARSQIYMEGWQHKPDRPYFVDVVPRDSTNFSLDLHCGHTVEQISFSYTDPNMNPQSTVHGGADGSAMSVTNLHDYDIIKITYGDYAYGTIHKTVAKLEFIDKQDSRRNVICGSTNARYYRSVDEAHIIDIEDKNIVGIIGQVDYGLVEGLGFVIAEHDKSGTSKITVEGSPYYGDFDATDTSVTFFSTYLPANAQNAKLHMRCGDTVNGLGFHYDIIDHESQTHSTTDYYGHSGGDVKEIAAETLYDTNRIKVHTGTLLGKALVTKIEFLNTDEGTRETCGTNQYASGITVHELDIDTSKEVLVGIRGSVKNDIKSVSFIISRFEGYQRLRNGVLETIDHATLQANASRRGIPAGNDAPAISNYIAEQYPQLLDTSRSKRSVFTKSVGWLWHKAAGWVKTEVKYVEKAAGDLYHGHPLNAARDLIDATPAGTMLEGGIKLYHDISKSKLITDLFNDIAHGQYKQAVVDGINDTLLAQSSHVVDWARGMGAYERTPNGQGGSAYFKSPSEYAALATADTLENLIGAYTSSPLTVRLASNLYQLLPAETYTENGVVEVEMKPDHEAYTRAVFGYFLGVDSNTAQLLHLAETMMTELKQDHYAFAAPNWIPRKEIAGNDSVFVADNNQYIILLADDLKDNPDLTMLRYTEELGHALDWIRAYHMTAACPSDDTVHYGSGGLADGTLCGQLSDDAGGDEGARFKDALLSVATDFSDAPTYDTEDHFPVTDGWVGYVETYPSSVWGQGLINHNLHLTLGSRLGLKIDSRYKPLGGKLSTDIGLRVSMSAPKFGTIYKDANGNIVSPTDNYTTTEKVPTFSVKVGLRDAVAFEYSLDKLLKKVELDGKWAKFALEVIRNHGIRFKFRWDDAVNTYVLTNEASDIEYVEEMIARPKLEVDYIDFIDAIFFKAAYGTEIPQSVKNLFDKAKLKYAVSGNAGIQWIWSAVDPMKLQLAAITNLVGETVGAALGAIVASYFEVDPTLTAEAGSWAGELAALGINYEDGERWDYLHYWGGAFVAPAEFKLSTKISEKAGTSAVSPTMSMHDGIYSFGSPDGAASLDHRSTTGKNPRPLEPYFKLQPRLYYTPLNKLYDYRSGSPVDVSTDARATLDDDT